MYWTYLLREFWEGGQQRTHLHDTDKEKDCTVKKNPEGRKDVKNIGND